MSCEVHLILDPDQPAGLVPWRVIDWNRRIEVALPARALGQMTVVAEPYQATLQVAGQIAFLTRTRHNQLARTDWMLPDGGYVLINDCAFNYAMHSWWYNA